MAQTDSNAAATKPVAASPQRAMLIFAGWGILSGIACYFAVKYLIDVKVLRLSFYPFGQHEGAAPIPPGIIFGLVIADCVRHFGVRSWLMFLLVVLVTTAAWIAAYDVTVWADMQIGKYRDAIDTLDTLSRTAEPQPGQPAPAAAQAWRWGEPLSFALGGLIGGFGTWLAAALAHPRARRPGALIVTLVLATAIGATFDLTDRLGDAGIAVFFAVWQAAVAASLARELARP